VADTCEDRPEASTRADVTLVTDSITVTAAVDPTDDGGLVVRPVGTAAAWQAAVRPGDRVDVYWVSGYEERMLPATVAAVEGTPGLAWRLRQTGPSTRGERRETVRGRVELPVTVRWSGAQLTGTTADLSEGGTRAIVDGAGVSPGPGSEVSVTLALEDGICLDLVGEVVWQDVSGPKWLVAMRFSDVSEDDRAALRRRVFRALRDERRLIGG
jgi:hypothetical protein